MSQNIYDNREFYKNYTEFSLAKKGIEFTWESEYLKKLLPKFEEKNILDLGCGHGEFCRNSIKNRANFVLGIDISNNMIDYANNELNKIKDQIDINQIKFEIQDLESLKLNKNDFFDLVFSRFTFHYIKNLKNVLTTVNKSMKQGGVLIFSVEHPIKTSSKYFDDMLTIKDNNQIERSIWAVSDYSNEGKRIRSWLGVDGVIKQHRTISSYINILISCGFIVECVEELLPTEEQLVKFDLKKKNELIKNFMLIIKSIKK